MGEKETLPGQSHEGTARHLKGRHLAMIAIGGTIGTGLFVNSGDLIAGAGAVGALIAYAIAGMTVFCVVMSLGEMATLIPISGSFNSYAARFVDPALGFTSGWTYWFQWVMSLPLELMAATSFLNYWMPNVNQYFLFGLLLTILLGLNLFSVKGYGETEYWLSLTKVLAIILFIVAGFVIVFRDNLGFSSWSVGTPAGPFIDRGGPGILKAMVGACFAFGGTELVGITAGEAANPRVAVPKAINGTFYRITIFYIVSVFLIGLILPASYLKDLMNASSLAKSPFVLAFKKANIPAADHIMNFVGFIAVFSAANSSVYASSRTMMSLCQSGSGPAFLAKVSSGGVPVAAVLISSFFGGISFLGKIFGDGVIFDWLVNCIGLTIIVTWMCISISHIRFRWAYVHQGYKIQDLPYKSPIGIVGDYISLFLNTLVIFFSGTADYIFFGQPFVFKSFVANYVGLILYPILYIGYKVFTGNWGIVPIDQVDLLTGHVSNHDVPEDAEPVAESRWEKILNIVA